MDKYINWVYNIKMNEIKLGGNALNPKETALSVAEILDSKKARDIKILDISALTTIADFFVICSAASATQVKALADNTIEKMSEKGAQPLRNEGYKSFDWILIDYGDVIVHIFKDDARTFYNLEHLWGDAENVEFDFE